MSSHSLAPSSKKRSCENAMDSDRGGKKKSAEKSNDTATPACYSNDDGRRFFENNYESFFYDPVGLPLVAAFHGEALAHLPPSYPVKAFPPQIQTNDKGNSILSEICSAMVSTEMKEEDLAKQLHDEIKLTFSDHFDVKTETLLKNGRSYGGGLTFLPKSKEGHGADKPLCVLEVGLSSDDWWEKFDQGAKYLNVMHEQLDGPYCFNELLLLAIITVDGKKKADASHDFDICMGVFLCYPRDKDLRMSLIWHKRQFAMEHASKSFGFLLRILDHFETQRREEYVEECDYFSSNCIKAGDMILRVYDSRFLESVERPDLYLDTECSANIVGAVKTVLAIPPLAPAEADKQLESPELTDNETDNAETESVAPYILYDRENFFTETPIKRILVIATPFREGGGHVARYPEDFLPIIDHLEQLHEAGYVHGDIRARNVVFPKTKGGTGYLIDFDFSGKVGEVEYPSGYNEYLPDGYRTGSSRCKIKKWHDWYALGWLIFDTHTFHAPNEGERIMFDDDFSMRELYWKRVEADPSAEDICELKKYLSELQEKGWTVQASQRYQNWLDKHT